MDGKTRNFPMTLFPVMLIMVAPFLFLMYIPYLPVITLQLGTTTSAMQLSVSFYLISYALSHLVYGPMAQRFGWQKMLMLGMALLFIGCLLPIMIKNITVFNLSRILQGFGAGAASTTAFYFIRHHFDHMALLKRISLLSVAFTLASLLGPMIGIYLLSWENSFLFIVMVAFLIFLGSLVMVQNEASLPDKDQTVSILAPLKDKTFVTYTLCASFIFCIPAIIISMFPFVFFNILNLLPEAFAWMVLLVIFSYLLGAILGGQLAPRFGINEMITLGLILCVSMSAVGLLLASLNHITIQTIVIPVAFVMIGAGMVFPNAISGALLHFKHSPAISSAMINFLFSTIAGIITIITAHIHFHDHVPITGMILVCSLAAVIIFWLLAPGKNRHPRDS